MKAVKRVFVLHTGGGIELRVIVLNEHDFLCVDDECVGEYICRDTSSDEDIAQAVWEQESPDTMWF